MTTDIATVQQVSNILSGKTPSSPHLSIEDVLNQWIGQVFTHLELYTDAYTDTFETEGGWVTMFNEEYEKFKESIL